MTNRFIKLCVILLLCLASSTQKTCGVSQLPEGHDFSVAADVPYKQGELIVRFAPKGTGQQRNNMEKRQIINSIGGGTLKRNYKIVPGLCLIKLSAGCTVKDALKLYNKKDGILYAESNYEIILLSNFPNDPCFPLLWGLHNTGQTGGTEDADIDAPEAWDIETDSNIIVAVLDTGVDYNLPDLSANMWTNEEECALYIPAV